MAESDTIPAPVRGRDGAREFMKMYVTAFPDLHFHVDHTLYREPDTATVTGIALIPPRGRGDVAVAGFLPFVVQLESPDPTRGLPRRWPSPTFDDGPHLSYAIQWFSFALIALVGTAVLIRKGR